MADKLLVIACGALAREISALKRRHGWHHLEMQCMDARLHNRPALIPERLRQKIRTNRSRYDRIFVAYADCGTSGAIDKLIAEEGVDRLSGAHCYQFFAGPERFAELAETEPGTFYLTDFLVRHFDKLVIRPLKLDTHPELQDAYFGNYEKLVYLAQTSDAGLETKAKHAAARLGLTYERIHCGYGGLGRGLKSFMANQEHGQEDTHLLA